MDSVREFSINNKREYSAKEAAKEVLTAVLEGVKTFFQFLLYVTEYAVSAAYRAVRSEKLAYVLGRYKKIMLGVSAGVTVFALIGVIGGMEAGLISFAIGVPVSLALAFAFRYLSENQ
jgi:hypothetical protein